MICNWKIHAGNKSITYDQPAPLASCVHNFFQHMRGPHVQKLVYASFLFCPPTADSKKTLTVKKKAKPNKREQLLNSR